MLLMLLRRGEGVRFTVGNARSWALGRPFCSSRFTVGHTFVGARFINFMTERGDPWALGRGTVTPLITRFTVGRCCNVDASQTVLTSPWGYCLGKSLSGTSPVSLLVKNREQK